MGIYLNSTSACTLYQNESIKPYFVDKTQMLEEIFPLIEEGSNYICITRPRRFGKTVMANMIASFLVKGEDSHSIFCDLDIARSEKYAKHMNQHNVIYISFNEIPYGCKSYLPYIERIQKGIIRDLKRAYSNLELEISDSVWDILREIHEYGRKEKFVFEQSSKR